MRAVGFTANLPITEAGALVDLELPEPEPRARDLVVRVEAVSVNPRDWKTRKTVKASPERPVVAGYDAVGVVVGRGAEARLFEVGERVFYAGALDRAGSNSERHAVDERIVARAPGRIGGEAAASLPLTALTAWEMLFDRLGIPIGAKEGAVLVIGGAGGVPSVGIQLLRALTGLVVIGTASRPESEAWVRARGAHHVIDHSRAMAPQVKELGVGPVPWVFCTHTDEASWAAGAAIVAPQGKFGLIDDPGPLDLRAFKAKSASIHWEAMFTRPMFGTADMGRQGEILGEVARLVDEGLLEATGTESFGATNAANLTRAHAAVEAGRVIGKVTLRGFE